MRIIDNRVGKMLLGHFDPVMYAEINSKSIVNRLNTLRVKFDGASISIAFELLSKYGKTYELQFIADTFLSPVWAHIRRYFSNKSVTSNPSTFSQARISFYIPGIFSYLSNERMIIIGYLFIY